MALSFIKVLETFFLFHLIFQFNNKKRKEEGKMNSVLIVTWVTPLISIVEHPVGRTESPF